jgi:hypothetical protein
MTIQADCAGKKGGPGGKRSLPRWYYCGFAGLLALAMVSGAEPPASPAAPEPEAPVALAAALEGKRGSPMDEPLRLLAQARTAYAKVQDYSCTLISRERIGGRLTPNNIVLMKVKERPFRVYLRWTEPRSQAGQEVCYATGRYQGEMRVHPNGILSTLGWVTLSPDDPRARKTSQHRITEAGISNLIGRFEAGWAEERRLGQTQVRIGTYEYNRRRCVRVETTHPTNANGRLLAWRNVVYFDKETKLPIRLECYDWPRSRGQPGEMIEVFSYINVRLNPGLPDADFIK